MKKNTTIKLPKYFLFLLFFTQVCVAQLSNFNLTVVHTNETCTANGTLTFTTTGTTPGASMLYSIYLLPNTTTPIATLSGNTYTGLVAGTYRIVATQTLGTQNGSQQQDRTILNQITPLTYQLVGQNSVACFNNGQITVNVATGTAVSYEIFAGPVIKPLQPSNVFTGLAPGVYQIRVFDACGEGVVQTYTLASSPSGLQISAPGGNPPTNCSTVPATHVLSAGGSGAVIAYPLTVVLTLYPPTGAPIVYNQTIASGNPSSVTFSQEIALYANLGYAYTITVTDGCGAVYSLNSTPANSNITPIAIATSGFVNCVASGAIQISMIQTAVLVSAPAAYANPLPHNYTGQVNGGMLQLANMPVGSYTFNVTDVCGNTHVLQVTVNAPGIQQPNYSKREGCDAASGSVSINCPSGPIASIVMTEAPAAYTLGPLPHNVNFNISPFNPQNFQMNSLPVGNYKFHITDNCGNQFDVIVPINGLQVSVNTMALTENCNSFNLGLNYTSNNAFNNTFWLQEFNPVTNQWGHPGTGVAYPAGNILSALYGVQVYNNTVNMNLAYLGTFRIIMGFNIFGNGSFLSTYCTRVLHEFVFDGVPKITDVYSFSCSGNTSDVIVNATGLAPLTYRITTKNGLPFVVQNGTSNTFLALEPAVYNFQVQDGCGNIINSLHDISNPYSFQITATDFCDGQTASLSVAPFSFLTYQWWEASAPTVILSTTSTLSFPAFNGSNDQGTYFVSIVNPNNASCINQTLSFVVNPGQNSPDAGTGGTISYCGSQNNIDLFILLSGNYDTNGTWSAVSPGGTLSANVWNAAGVASGVYQFKYTVTGFCNVSDEATVTITLQATPQTPIASATPVICDGQALELFATAIPNATYEWTGPNGFTSNLQNPVINGASATNNGTYTVQALQNGCPSAATSVLIQVAPIPQFDIAFECIDNVALLLATPIQNSFDSATATYQWSNANGFSGSDNPITITGEPTGIYSLTVTNTDGCSNTVAIDVANTLCAIPIGISPNNDGLNDAFDLSGFSGITNVKIFNRYGMVVFDQDNYVKEWMGQDKKGNILPSATYFYLINFENDGPKTGWVYLLRENN